VSDSKEIAVVTLNEQLKRAILETVVLLQIQVDLKDAPDE
jgi:hypothetical protein